MLPVGSAIGRGDRTVLRAHRQMSGLAGISGFTLVELLVGLAVSAIVLLTLALSWSLVVRDQVYVLSVTALNNDLRSLMQIITQDARRAIAPERTAADQFFVEVVRSGNDAPFADCVVFNTHIGGEEVGPEAELRFLWTATPGSPDAEGPTLVPSGYRLRGGQLEAWAPPRQTGTTFSDGMDDDDFQAFGKCALTTAGNDNWWTPLFVSGDRGVFIDSFGVSVSDDSVCLDLNDPTADRLDRCLQNDRNKVEVLRLDFELAGRVRVLNTDREFEFADSVRVRNDWVIGDF